MQKRATTGITLSKIMIVIVAGGIGAGKSAVMKILEDLGAKVIYADVINKQLLQDVNYIKKLGECFPSVVQEGKINKKELRNIIFNDELARLRLNAIAHPLIFKKIDELTRGNGVFFVEIPLFEECHKNIKFDKLCAVKASKSIRANRVASRDDISIESALKIIEAQYKEEEIYDRADFIIYNENDFEDLKNQVIEIYNNVQ